MTTLTTTYRPAYRPGLLGLNVFEDVLDGFFSDFPQHLKKSTQGYPIVDIYKSEEGSTIMEFALAGFQKDNLHVQVVLEKNEIHVSSDSHGDEELPNFNSRRIARRCFHKTFVNYDNNLDLSGVSASFKDGLLRVTVPKRPEAEYIKVVID